MSNLPVTGIIPMPNFVEVDPGLFVDLSKVVYFTIQPMAPVPGQPGKWVLSLFIPGQEVSLCDIFGENRNELLAKLGLGQPSGIIKPAGPGRFN